MVVAVTIKVCAEACPNGCAGSRRAGAVVVRVPPEMAMLTLLPGCRAG
jgi:hypothetical protein